MKAFLRQLLNPKIDCKHAGLLCQLQLFRTLTQRELSLIELILHERTYLSEEVIFEEGEQGLGMYIILEGSVKVIRRGAQRNVLGKQEIATLGPGESFGELALLSTEARRSATVIATAPTRLLSLFQAEFFRLLQTHNRLGFKVSYQMACNMADRFRGMIEKGAISETI
jgi:CRP-like cAMP-binding protein